MRRSIAVAAVAAFLASPAAAGDWQSLRKSLAALSASNPQASAAGWAFWDCAHDAATKLAERPEPKLEDADWRPSYARPTLQQEIALVMASCSLEESRLAKSVAAVEMRKLKASIAKHAVSTIEWVRAQDGLIRIAPQPK
jgi:hypothetical protein